MSEKKFCETVTMTYEEFCEREDFPSHFFCKSALGDYVFFKTHNRKKAVECMENMFGKAYTLRVI